MLGYGLLTGWWLVTSYLYPEQPSFVEFASLITS
jgi:hypothetical protein